MTAAPHATALLVDAREAHVQAYAAIALLRGIVREVAARPGPEAAERELLRVAVRAGLDLGAEPPLTGPRALLWAIWRRWGLGVDLPSDAAQKLPRGARARWTFVRQVVGELRGSAEGEAVWSEIAALEQDGRVVRTRAA